MCLIWGFILSSLAIGKPCNIGDVNKLFIEGETCSSFEVGLIENVKANIQKRSEYCQLAKDCYSDTESEFKTSEDILREMTTQSLRPVFETIASANKDLDSEFEKGNISNCSVNQFNQFSQDCQDKLKKINITSDLLSKSISEILSDKKDSNQCLENRERLYILSMQGQKNIYSKLSADKEFINKLISERDEKKFQQLVKEKAGIQYDALISNGRLKTIFSSSVQLKSFIDNNESLSALNQVEWAKQLDQNCKDTFKSLEEYLCKKVPEGAFAFSDFKLNKNFKVDQSKSFKGKYCSTQVKELELSSPFDINTANPNYREEVKSSTIAINQIVCPLKVKCDSQVNQAACLKTECNNIANAPKSDLTKTKTFKFQKTFCEDLFDFKNGGAVKNQELVDFLAEKRTSNGSLGLASANQSKLMNYFMTPTASTKVAESGSSNNTNNAREVVGKQNNNVINNNSSNTNYNQPQNIQTSSGQNGIATNPSSKNKIIQPQNGNNSGVIETSETESYEKTIQAQNELLDRLERAKNQQNQPKNVTGVSGNSKGAQDFSQKDQKNLESNNGNSGDPTVINNGNTVVNNVVDPSKTKNTDRSVSSNGTGSSVRDNTRVNGISGSLSGTSLEDKNNISSSMEVNKEGQYKVTLKNLDPKTLNMDLFKDEVKKQAKEAIDKGIPFVISIVNNDTEITINMIPKEKNGKITYIPTPIDESAESLAFAEKLTNSFHSELKSKSKEKSQRVYASDLEQGLK